MPTSHPFQLNQIMHLVIQQKPESVLEIGVGFGKYGLLLREYLEIWGEGEEYSDFKRQIDGIEIYEPYILAHHEQIYDRIYKGNALDILPELEQYDLILLIDVLEHFDYDDAVRLLSLCQEKSKAIIISTPKDIGQQEGGYGNVYETHRSQWTRQLLSKTLGRENFFIPNPHSHLVMHGSTGLIELIKKGIRKSWKVSALKQRFYTLYQILMKFRF